MKPIDIARRRLRALGLEGKPLASADEAVRWMGAVQSQEFGMAKWSLGERVRGITDADVQRAFDAGAILRTHVLRPTWHFVHPHDIRWIQELTAAKVHAQNAYMYRQTGMDDGIGQKSNRVLRDVLRGGNHLTRRELESVLEREGIAAKAVGMAYILIQAELDCLVCSGPMQGKQHTYALLEERAPDARSLPRDEALAELVVRYFTSHGPATAKDMRWWSSLTLAEILQGVEAAGDRLREEVIGGVSYWSAPARAAKKQPSPKVYLLQGYDEYFVGYSESRGVIGGQWGRPTLPESASYLGGVVLDTQLVGRWKRAVGKRAVTFTVALPTPFDDARMQALHDAADRQGAFLDLPAIVEIASV
jgi:hypothetical protein